MRPSLAAPRSAKHGAYIHRERYQAPGPEMARQMAEHGITSLAQFYTSDLKYAPSRCEATSEQFSQLLVDQGYTDRLRERRD